MTEVELTIEKLLRFYQVYNISDLANKMKITQATISNWKNRNSVNAIKKKCRELKIYDEIFGTNIQEISNSSNIELEKKSDLSKYFTALQYVAIATNKEDELLTDIRELIKKYMQ